MPSISSLSSPALGQPSLASNIDHLQDLDAKESGGVEALNQGATSNGDYSTRLEEILGADDENAEAEEDEEFIYEGEDAVIRTGDYQERMQAIIGSEDEVDELLLAGEPEFSYLDASMDEVLPDHSISPKIDFQPPPSSDMAPPSRPSTPSVDSLVVEVAPSKARPAFLHPSVSRLRSYTPSQRPRLTSTSTMNSLNTLASLPNGASPALSHFSDISRSSTPSNSNETFDDKKSIGGSETVNPREPFRWTALRTISSRVYPSSSAKPSAILGVNAGAPTVLAANGLLCIGMSDGRTLVFDFKQQLKCICGSDLTAKDAGAVTAVCLSHDHTFLGVGHAQGHVYLYELSRPQAPARSVLPTTMAAVASGRREGHLVGSAIRHLSFVGARHTAIVSADGTGLAFYHSLGKVLFIEASDVLRVLGRYPDEQTVELGGTAMNGAAASGSNAHWQSNILALSALPLGPVSHPTEAYDLVALLTPIKLIIVGLRPSARTWFRRHRDLDDTSERADAALIGCLAWFPSVSSEDAPKSEKADGQVDVPTRPVLAYSWGRSVMLLRTSEDRPGLSSVPARKGRRIDEPGKVVFEEGARWTAESNIVALQWLNSKQLLIFAEAVVDVLDIRSMQSVERATLPLDFIFTNGVGGQGATDAYVSVAARLAKVYKGKVFILGGRQLRVGSLRSWRDHILWFMQQGDFVGAIDLCRDYLTGEASGNKSGLPEDADGLRQVVGTKISELMIASARYAFSEERMRDGTHDAPDGRGVDRTSLFEKLVSSCAEACIALGDCDFLFDDLYERYQDFGIESIFLAQLEPFVLDHRIRAIPPHVSQRLIALHDERGEYERAEALIWHMDPLSLDINQAINLCCAHQLYDALIYVYTCCLQDFVTPLEVLLNVISQVSLVHRAKRDERNTNGGGTETESLERHAYKVYSYLADVLSGIAYPTADRMDEDVATEAKRSVYSFLFFGRSSSVSSSSDNDLRFVDEAEDGKEQTYPILRMLLRFDAEAFLHVLDLAFEDSYLNDDTQGVNRQVVINVLLEISMSPGLRSSDMTFLNIFVARNAPKYPQFVQITPRIYDRILLSLAGDPDQSTTEDRQLAAEFLLSTYTPHDGDRLISVFEQAKFYRILRSIYTQERKWPALTSTYLRDTDLDRIELFDSLDNTLTLATRSAKGLLPSELEEMILDAISRLLDSSVFDTALLVEKHLSLSHTQVLQSMPHESYNQFAYLRFLIEPHLLDSIGDDERGIPRRPRLEHIDPTARRMYIDLMCEFDPAGIIRTIQNSPAGFFNLSEVISLCGERKVYDMAVWCLDKEAGPIQAFDKLEIVLGREASLLAGMALSDDDGDDQQSAMFEALDRVTKVTKMGLRLCQERTLEPDDSVGIDVEEMWFRLLHAEINMAQTISSSLSKPRASGVEPDGPDHSLLTSIRDLVQDTLLTLISTPSSRARALSFPALFARLVNSISASSHPASYSEFRAILTGMLGHYRSEGDVLIMTNRLVAQDLFDAVEELTRRRRRGWRAGSDGCGVCGKALHPEGTGDVVVTFSGVAYHQQCFHSSVSQKNTSHQ